MIARSFRLSARVVLCLLFLPAAAAAQNATSAGVGRVRLSIDDAVGLALEANEESRIARTVVDRTRGQVREALSGALPSVDGSYRMTRNLQRPVLFLEQNGETVQIEIGDENEHAFGITFEQTLFDPRLGAAVRAARHGRAASRASYDRALSNVALRTRQAYTDVLLATAQLGVRETAVVLRQARLDQVRLFADLGTASEFDLLTAQVAVENEEPERIRAANRLRLATNALKRVVGLPLDTDLSLTDTLAFEPVEIDLEVATRRALTDRGDLISQQRTVDLSREILNVERGESYPTLSLRLDLSRQASSSDFVPDDSDFNQSASASLALDIPIFDGRRSQGRELQASADHVAAREQLRALEQDARLETLDAWQTAGAAAEAVRATRATGSLARRAYEIAQVRFRNGLSTQLELDEAEQDLLEVEANAAAALYAHMNAAAALRHAMGER